MVAFRFSALAALCATLVIAAPAPAQGPTKRMFDKAIPHPTGSAPKRMFDHAIPVLHNGSVHELERRSNFGPPYWVVYQDAWNSGETGPPATSTVAGYNVFIMSFLLAAGSVDQVTEWQELTSAQRAATKAAYNAAGIKLMVSAFGSSDFPTSSGYNAVTLAQQMTAWVLQYNVDGIDVDYEDFTAMNRRDGTAENWLITFTQTLRQQLPQGQYIITHAPVAPWFAGALYTSGAYATVNAKVGNLIDWYNIQFYNQGTTEYTTCAGLLTQSSSTWPNSAVFQIAAGGVPLNKIVIGKPSTPGDATGGAGYIDPNTLASCLQQAKAQGWSAGAMFWQFPHATSSFIATVRALSWPVGSSPPPPPPSTTITPTPTSSPHSTTPTSTPTGGSGQCSGVAAWTSGVAYNGGTKAVYNGHLWTAKWWSEGDVPGSAAGDWTDDGPC